VAALPVGVSANLSGPGALSRSGVVAHGVPPPRPHVRQGGCWAGYTRTGLYALRSVMLHAGPRARSAAVWSGGGMQLLPTATAILGNSMATARCHIHEIVAPGVLVLLLPADSRVAGCAANPVFARDGGQGFNRAGRQAPSYRLDGRHFDTTWANTAWTNVPVAVGPLDQPADQVPHITVTASQRRTSRAASYARPVGEGNERRGGPQWGGIGAGLADAPSPAGRDNARVAFSTEPDPSGNVVSSETRHLGESQQQLALAAQVRHRCSCNHKADRPGLTSASGPCSMPSRVAPHCRRGPLSRRRHASDKPRHAQLNEMNT
jgi:hypothetical protein